MDSEAGSERRNPSRKARPPENFAVEEKSEPRSVDVRRLLEVGCDSVIVCDSVCLFKHR